jgi:4-amino-4-deoxy-L-arabinose transferase-like glycosyltransferase
MTVQDSQLILNARPSKRLERLSRLDENVYLALLGLLLLSAALLRLYSLNSGLWLDEVLTLVKYARLPYTEIVQTFDSENQHFLYSILSHTSLLLFGESVWALRLPAMLFGVGSIWALYLLGCEVATSKEALISATLLTFSYHHVWFSQNARGYTGLLFWTLISTWLLVRCLRNGSWREWALYAVAAALGVYTHLTMLFVILGQGIVALVTIFTNRKRQLSGWTGLVLGFGLAGLLTLLLHLPALSQILGTVAQSEQSVVTAWKSPIWTALEIVRGLRISFAGGVVALGAFLFFGAGLWSYARSSPIIPGLLLLPSLIGAAITIAVGHHLWPRFFFFAIGFAVLVALRGIKVIVALAADRLRLPEQRAALLETALSAGLVLVSALSVPLAYGPKQDYEGALAYVEHNRAPGDAVVTVSLTALPYRELYQTGWTEVTSRQALDAVRAQADRTWLLYTFPAVLEAVYPDVMASIQSDFSVVKQFNGTVGEGAILVAVADRAAARIR